MPAHRRKKIEIVVEAPLARKVLDWLARRGVTGHTLIPHVSGSGRHGARGPGEVSGIFENVLIVAIARDEVAYRVLEDVETELRDTVGIVCLSDVEVARGEHF